MSGAGWSLVDHVEREPWLRGELLRDYGRGGHLGLRLLALNRKMGRCREA